MRDRPSASGPREWATDRTESDRPRRLHRRYERKAEHLLAFVGVSRDMTRNAQEAGGTWCEVARNVNTASVWSCAPTEEKRLTSTKAVSQLKDGLPGIPGMKARRAQ
ncbi:hypothetical protein GCM10018789_19640 [Streptomyces werraensis]|nr:hypothetical protein GCM10018789_19640 [Streptomyces werraensis]